MTNNEYNELSQWMRFWYREGAETHALRVVELSRINGSNEATCRAHLKYTRTLFGAPIKCESMSIDTLGSMRAMTESEVSIAAIICHYVAEQIGRKVLKEDDDIQISHKGNECHRVWLVSFRSAGGEGRRSLYELHENDMHVELMGEQ